MSFLTLSAEIIVFLAESKLSWRHFFPEHTNFWNKEIKNCNFLSLSLFEIWLSKKFFAPLLLLKAFLRQITSQPVGLNTRLNTKVNQQWAETEHWRMVRQGATGMGWHFDAAQRGEFSHNCAPCWWFHSLFGCLI